MKQPTALALALSLAALAALGACARSSSTDPLGSSSSGSSGSGGGSSAPAATPTPATGPAVPLGSTGTAATSPPLNMIALSNGSLGSYNGVNLSVVVPPGATTSISGLPLNPGSLRVSTLTGQQAPYLNLTFCSFSIGSCASSSLFPTLPMLTSSRLEFDLFIEAPLSDINNVTIYYGPDNHKGQRRLSVAELTAATTGFTSFSLPGSSFQFPAGASTNTKTSSIFQITLVKIVGTSTQGFAINDVRWVP